MVPKKAAGHTHTQRWMDERTHLRTDRHINTDMRANAHTGGHINTDTHVKVAILLRWCSHGGFVRELFKGLFRGWWAAFKTFQTRGEGGR